MEKKTEDKVIIQKAVAKQCSTCGNSTFVDLQGVKVPNGMIWCNLWNGLKNSSGWCSNWRQ